MGLYVRGNTLWLTYTDAAGERQYKSTGLPVGEEAEARKALAKIERQIAAQERTGIPAGALTVKSYADQWTDARQERGVINASSEAGFFKHHINPAIGDVPLSELRPVQVRDLLDVLKRKKTTGRRKPTKGPDGKIVKPPERPLSSRSVRHIMGTLRNMLGDALAAELIPSNPFQLRARKDLPVARDVDPTWREGARFSSGEVEQLISDERIPEDRRVWYALATLTGARPGEIIAVRWRHYSPELEPLGLLQFAYAFNSNHHVLKDTKTQTTHKVPVHKTLAKVLATWRLGGWERTFGRAPTPDDLILPAQLPVEGAPAEREFRRDNRVRDRLHEDLTLLGLRKRDLYDFRRTFVSIAEDDGVSRENVEWLIHGPRGDVHDGYRSPAHSALCAEVAKIKIGLREGRVLELRRAAVAGAQPPETRSASPKKRDSRVTVQQKGPGSRDPGPWAILVSNQ